MSQSLAGPMNLQIRYGQFVDNLPEEQDPISSKSLVDRCERKSSNRADRYWQHQAEPET